MFSNNIIYLQKTTSTSAQLKEMLTNDRLPEGTVVATHEQTNGRGISNSSWESEPHKNLTFSFVVYPHILIERQFILNKAISLGIYDCVHAILPDKSVKIKWPNDIYIDNKKLCGILIENSLMGERIAHVIVGIGLNVNQTEFTGTASNPVSLKNVSGITYDLEKTLSQLLDAIYIRYKQFLNQASDKIETDYISVLYRINEWHNYLINGDIVNACINGVSPHGELMLSDADNRKFICGIKEIKFMG